MKGLIGMVLGFGKGFLRSKRKLSDGARRESNLIVDVRHEISEIIEQNGSPRDVRHLLELCPKAIYPCAGMWLALSEAMAKGDIGEVGALLIGSNFGTFPHAEKWIALEDAMARSDRERVEQLLGKDSSEHYKIARAWLIAHQPKKEETKQGE